MLLKRWMRRRPLQFLICFGLLGATMGVVIPWVGARRPEPGTDAAVEPGASRPTAPTSRVRLPVPELVRRIRPAVVTIVTEGESGEELAEATGFLCAPRHVLTNHHVMDGAHGAWVVTDGGMECDVVGVVREDEEHDLVVLEIAEDIEDAAPVPLASAPAAAGVPILIVGSPLSLEANVTEGVVSSLADVEGLGRVLQLSVGVSRNASGSPVLNLQGEAVGVATHETPYGDARNVAVPAWRIRALNVGTSAALFTRREDLLAERQRQSSWLVKSAMESMGAKDWTAGLEAAKDAIREDPASADAWWCRGACLTGLRQLVAAREALVHALSLEPTHRSATVALARVAVDLHRSREARRHARRAELMTWKMPKELYLVAEVFRDLEDDDGALRCIERVLELDPRSGRARDLCADIHFHRGVTAFQRGRFDEALAAFDECLDIGGDNARTHFNIALVQAGLKRWNLCILHSRRSLEFDPDSARARLQLGRALLETGDLGAAEAQAKMLERLDPAKAQSLHAAILKGRYGRDGK